MVTEELESGPDSPFNFTLSRLAKRRVKIKWLREEDAVDNSIEEDIARKAIEQSLMTASLAQYCLAMAQIERKPFLSCAVELGVLSTQQAERLIHLQDSALRLKAMPLPRPGEQVGDYEILGQLGQGGMGCVFKARPRGQSRVVALKFLIESDEKARARLAREAETLAQVGSHPHVMGIHGVGSRGQDIFLILDYVEGQDLAERMKRASFEPEDALKLVVKIARALAFIHEKKVLHRDLKPSNILMREADNEPILTDFGLAKTEHSRTLTQSEEILGTPFYMSPEQADGQSKTIAPSSEVFSLGVILYELLTGVRPFQGRSFYELVGAILNCQVTPPSSVNPKLSKSMDRVVLTALAKDPKRRYAKMSDFAEDCERLLMGEDPLASAIAGPLGGAARVKKALGLGLLLVIIVGFAIFFEGQRREAQGREKWREETLGLFQTMKKSKAARDFLREDRTLALLAQFALDKKLERNAATRELFQRFEKLEKRLTERSLEGEFATLLQSSRLLRELQAFEGHSKALYGVTHEPPENSFDKALLALKKGQFAQAREHFQRVKETEKDKDVLASFGVAISVYKQGQFRRANEALRECFLKSEQTFVFVPLFQESLLADTMQAVFSAQSQRELEGALAQLRRYDKPPYQTSKQDLSERWVKRLSKRLEEVDSAEFARVFEWLAAAQSRYPRYASLKASPTQLAVLGLNARKQGDLLKAYKYFIRAGRGGVPVPKGVTREQFSADMVYFLNSVRMKREPWFDLLIDLILLGVKRGWVFGQIRGNFSDPVYWPILEKCLNRRGKGPYVRFFKGRLRPRHSSKAILESQEDLVAALGSGKLIDEARGAAHYEYGKLLYGASTRGREREKYRRKATEQLLKSIQFQIPCPDKAYEMLFFMSRDQNQRLRFGRKMLYWSDRRAIRAQQALDKKPVEEPHLVPYELDHTEVAAKQIRLSMIAQLNNMGNHKEALEELRRDWPFFRFEPEPIEEALARYGLKEMSGEELGRVLKAKGKEEDRKRAERLFPNWRP